MGSTGKAGPGIFDGSTNQGFSDEKPEHEVMLSAYEIDLTEVTNRQYRACVAINICDDPNITDSVTRPGYYMDPMFDDYPVIGVTWSQAQTYCHCRGMSLPTEAQWERAARGDNGDPPYPWGYEQPNCWMANLSFKEHFSNDQLVETCVGDTTRVGHYFAQASPFGILDAIGNVAEWTADWYDPSYYDSALWPDNSQDPLGPPNGAYKTVRGGSFAAAPVFGRVSSRAALEPDSAISDVGFRCAKKAP